MRDAADPARTQAASRRFVSFFQELDRSFVERADVLVQTALSLLSREHLLLTGPPGTAKSLLVSSVLGRVLDETTGGPSFFARQFTESTVQTDLIGPINFKTLTETGRTEHFTDEGMLGAVHAFLDEVFDGRDMLLRSALNVLHERELKQGTRITKGKFECAMMASNRYLSEVLEGSRDTLLAFVDRIAFVAFVPRAFAHPEHLAHVLRTQIGGAGRPSLSEQLSVQDLDALQTLVDEVHISDEICAGIAELLHKFDIELNACVRADPGFVPTRYLSTRTAVRGGRVLRAACVYDKIFHRPDRPLEVMPDDLRALRFHLLISGPSPEDAQKLLAQESDPRERRQLELLRTEREIFDRCFAQLSPISVPARKPSGAGQKEAPAASGETKEKHAKAQPKPPKESAPAWELNAKTALESGDPKRITQIMPVLLSFAEAAPAHAQKAQELLDACVTALRARALTEGLAQGAEASKPLIDTAKEWCSLSRSLSGAPQPLRSLGRWLRGRALVLLSEHASYSLGTRASELDELTGKGPRSSQPVEQAQKLLAALESMSSLITEIMAEGVDPEAQAECDAHWKRSLAHTEDELVLLCDSAVREVAAERLSAIANHDLSGALERMAPEFDRIALLEQRFSALFFEGRPALRERVLGPRIALLVEASFRRISASDRIGLNREIHSLLGVLSRAGLAHIIAPSAWVQWTAQALLRAEKNSGADSLANTAKNEEPDYEGYRSLRNAGPRVPCAFVLAETALSVAPGLVTQSAPSGGEGFSGIAALFGELEKELRGQIIRFDFERLEEALSYLENWWVFLSEGEPFVLGDESKLSKDEQRIRSMVRSRFFTVFLEESAPARLALEARLLSELFPDQAGRAEGLRERVDKLSEAVHGRAYELFQRRAQAAWGGILKEPENTKA